LAQIPQLPATTHTHVTTPTLAALLAAVCGRMDSMRPLRLQLLALTAALVAAGTVSDGGSGAPASTPAADAALFSAVNKDSRMRIERALDDGADINAQDSKTGYFTPLMLAAQKGQGNAVPILLERGADTERADKDGFTAMHVAAFHGEVRDPAPALHRHRARARVRAMRALSHVLAAVTVAVAVAVAVAVDPMAASGGWCNC
jgi:hypothetical protein